MTRSVATRRALVADGGSTMYIKTVPVNYDGKLTNQAIAGYDNNGAAVTGVKMDLPSYTTGAGDQTWTFITDDAAVAAAAEEIASEENTEA